jgi:hypothetical protein
VTQRTLNIFLPPNFNCGYFDACDLNAAIPQGKLRKIPRASRSLASRRRGLGTSTEASCENLFSHRRFFQFMEAPINAFVGTRQT